MTFREKIYTLREETADGVTRYFISFKDGQGELHAVEVSHAVYCEFIAFQRINRNLQGFDERHREYSELTGEMLNRRSRNPPKSVEDAVIDNERSEILRRAIAELPEIQQRRFIFYHDYELKLREIGKLEGCGVSAVQRSIERAKGKIREKLSEV